MKGVNSSCCSGAVGWLAQRERCLCISDSGKIRCDWVYSIPVSGVVYIAVVVWFPRLLRLSPSTVVLGIIIGTAQVPRHRF